MDSVAKTLACDAVAACHVFALHLVPESGPDCLQRRLYRKRIPPTVPAQLAAPP